MVNIQNTSRYKTINNKVIIILYAIVIILNYLVTCKESWAEECFDLPQRDMNLCSIAKAKKIEQKLDDIYKKLMEKIDPENQPKLQAAQNAWIEYRKRQCEFDTLGTVGGSIHPTIVSDCYGSMAYQQRETLRQQLECEEGNLSCGGQ